ncbi:MAG: hypothetical protein KTR31_38065 [Myxococcales bacterium]|nr:hypothetical protein [Myxococcales bacterium]
MWVVWMVGCMSGTELTEDAKTDLTWSADVAAVVGERCAGCHQPEGLGGLPLVTYDDVFAARSAVRAAVQSGRMPPWMPSEECTSYVGDRSMSAEDEATLLEWIDGGAPAGDAAVVATTPTGPTLRADAVLPLPQGYSPQLAPDDYRCQLLDWTPDDEVFVTGAEVQVDRQDLVHHVIAFVIAESAVELYEGLDQDEPGPGWTCYGGPGGTAVTEDLELSDILAGNVGDALAVRTVASWVPGKTDVLLPEGTGLAMSPGERLILQMHYNSPAPDPGPDQSSLVLQLDDDVPRPAAMVALLDPAWVLDIPALGDPMQIPAGESDVRHSTTVDVDGLFFRSARERLGLAEDASYEVHTVGHHMHTLGTQGTVRILHDDGTDSCLLDIPDWDFDWQGSYTLRQSVVVSPGDQVQLSCSWDNSEGTEDVYWGEGTADEMCLGSLMVTEAR